MEKNSGIRLNKFIAESGICSRREADKFIEKGVVVINGRRAVIGDVVKPKDRVMVNGHKLEPLEAENKLYIAFNKPVGVTCTTEESTKGNIIDYVNHSARIFNIGRLDKDSQGLILLTNDGDIVNKILRAENSHQKEYIVTVDKPITQEFIAKMGNGVPILGVVTKKCTVEMVAPFVFKITLIQGLNRQIRRMCEYFGYEVRKLERTRIMNISLTGIPLGEWRDLTERELDVLFSMLKEDTSSPKTKAKVKIGPPKKTSPNNRSKPLSKGPNSSKKPFEKKSAFPKKRK
jgi:23S rRNA pseudouridine2604 synthase